uniref:Uncharacterized protein n=1 Tax=Solanum tuberosum TaxID=4113 RepID=M1AEQ4_SOLTU
MGRNIPLGEIHLIHHSLVYISFMIACFSATIAIFSSLCGSLTKKKSHPPPTTSSNTRDNNEKSFVNGTTSPKETSPRYDASFKRNSIDQLQGEDATFLQQPLPPPPSMRATSFNNSNLRANSMTPTTHSRSNSSNSSQGRLSTSVSVRAFGGDLGSRQSSRREDSNHDNKKKDKKLSKDEDSIWKKQIILGEKCKIPADEDDDTILYDENGNRISAYHPKPIVNQSSNIEEDAIPK